MEILPKWMDSFFLYDEKIPVKYEFLCKNAIKLVFYAVNRKK